MDTKNGSNKRAYENDCPTVQKDVTKVKGQRDDG